MAIITAAQEGSSVAPQVPANRPRWRVALSLIAVGLVALAVAWLGDPRAASFSDAGGRLASVKVMSESSTWLPDLGYWAEAHDASGLHHPILFSTPYGDRWVSVTSLPLVVAGRPLWDVGGARAAVLIPVLSVVLAACAACRLSRWASGGDGVVALWFVGLLSPLVFYGADFWEHAPALALALLGLTLCLEGGMRRAVAAGALAGLAAVMRNDLAVVFVAIGVAGVALPAARRVARVRWRELASAGATAVGVLAANAVLWRALFGSAGGSVRASKRFEMSGLQVAERLRDGIITSFGVFANEYWLALMIGIVVGIAILLMAAAATARSDALSMSGVVGTVVAWGGLAWRFATFGISTVPGFIAAAPVAALGLFGERTRREQLLWTSAVVAIPLVWMTEWVGGHSPQWGGRYLLLPTSLLVVLGAAQVRRLWPRPLIIATVGLGAVMSVVGMVWHVERTRSMVDFAHAVFDVPEDVVIVGDQPWMGSEVGTWYGDRRWLTAGADANGKAEPEDVAAAVAVARAADAATIDVIDSQSDAGDRIDDAARYPGYTFESLRVVTLFRSDVVIRRYVLQGFSGG